MVDPREAKGELQARRTIISGLDLGSRADYSAFFSMEQVRLEPPLGPRIEQVQGPGGLETIIHDSRPRPAQPRHKARYNVLGIHRWDLHTLYPVVQEEIAIMFSRPPLTDSTLVIDATGPGLSVFDWFRRIKVHGTDCPTCQHNRQDALQRALESGPAIWDKGIGRLGPNGLPCLTCSGTGKLKLRANLVPILITAGSKATPDPETGGFRVAKKALVSAMQVVFQSGRLDIHPHATWARLGIELKKELLNFKLKITAHANESFEAWRDSDKDDLVLSAAIALWYAERGGEFWIR